MNHKNINKLFSLLSSMKLAIVLLTTIAIITALSTLIIQGENPEYYLEHYPKLGTLFIITGFSNFFRSITFIILIALFFINLFLCTCKRIYKEFTKKIKINVGPDIIHIALLLLIIGGSINIVGQHEKTVMMNVGDEVKVGEFIVKLNEFNFLKYANGSPKDWVSNISIFNSVGNVISQNINVEVNKPLRLKEFAIYQSHYNVVNIVELESKTNKTYVIKSGYMFNIKNKSYILAEVDPGVSCLFQVNDENDHTEFVKYDIGQKIGDFTLINSSNELLSGLLIKVEPGFYINLIGYILMFIGFVYTYVQKLGVKET